MPKKVKNPSAVIIAPPHPLVEQIYRDLTQKKVLTAFLDVYSHGDADQISQNYLLKNDSLLYLIDATSLVNEKYLADGFDKTSIIEHAASLGVKHLFLSYQSLISWNQYQDAEEMLHKQTSEESTLATQALHKGLNTRIIRLTDLFDPKINHPYTRLSALFSGLSSGNIVLTEPADTLVSPLSLKLAAKEILRTLFVKGSQNNVFELTGKNAIPLINIALRLEKELLKCKTRNQPVTQSQAPPPDQVIRPKNTTDWEELIKKTRVPDINLEKNKISEQRTEKENQKEVSHESRDFTLNAPTPPSFLHAATPRQSLKTPPPPEVIASPPLENNQKKEAKDILAENALPKIEKTPLVDQDPTPSFFPAPKDYRREPQKMASSFKPLEEKPRTGQKETSLLPTFLQPDTLQEHEVQKKNRTDHKSGVVNPFKKTPRWAKILAYTALIITFLSTTATALIASPYALLYLTARNIEKGSVASTRDVEKVKTRLNQRYRLAVSANREIQPVLIKIAPKLETYLTSLVDQVYYQSQIELTRGKYEQLISKLLNQMFNQEEGDVYQTAQSAQAQASLLYQQQATLLAHDYLEEGKKEELGKNQEKIQAASTLLANMANILPKDKKVTYLLLLQNSLELRPTGGFTSSVAVVSFENGRFIDLNTQDVYQLDSQLNGRVDPPPEVERHLGETSWYLRDANWDPHFPTTAKNVEWFYEKQTGKTVDGTIALNLYTLRDIVEAVGEVQVKDGQTVTANTLFDKAQNFQDVTFENDPQKQELMSQIIGGVLEKITTSEEGKRAVASKMLDAIINNQLFVLTHNPSAQKALADIGATGELIQPICPPTLNTTNCITDYFYINEANVGVNKANYYLSRSHQHTVDIRGESVAHTHQLKLTNTAQTDAWPSGTYKTLIRAYAPPNARLKSLKVNQVAQNNSTVTTKAEHNKTVFSFYQEVPIQSTKNIELTYSVNKNKKADDLIAYTLLIQKQAGTGADPFVLRINHDSTTQPVSVSEPAQTEPGSLVFHSVLDANKFYAVELAR